LASLVNHVVDYFMKEFSKFSDITETESHRLHKICKQFWELEKLFSGIEFLCNSENGFKIRVANIVAFVPKWNKFKWITEILEMSLLQITESWNSNKVIGNIQCPLRQALSKEEVIFFIYDLFADGEIRRQRIKELV